MATSKPKTGRNTTAITNPKTKSQNTTANTKNAAAGGTKAPAQSGASAGNANKTAAAKSMIASGKSTGAKSAKSPAADKTASKARSCKTGSEGKPAAKSAGKAGAKMEAASDCPLKDMDIVSDVLGGQKALIKLYGTALCECDCTNLRTILNSQLSEAAKDQFDTFLYMNERGMYPTEQAPAPKVSKAVKQFTQKSSAFGK